MRKSSLITHTVIVLAERGYPRSREIYKDINKYRNHLVERREFSTLETERLCSLMPDVSWHQTSLLAHHPVRDYWIRSEADKAAKLFMKLIEGSPRIVVCCGGRLMSAFRPYYDQRPTKPGAGTTRNLVTFIRIPSLSIRNKQWMNDELIAKCKDRLLYEYSDWIRTNG